MLPREIIAADNSQTSLAVASPLRRRATAGAVVANLYGAPRPAIATNAAIFRIGGGPFRVVLYPKGLGFEGLIQSGAVLVGSVARDVLESASTHTVTPASGFEASAIMASAMGAVAAVKPRRTVESLIDALLDAIIAGDGGLLTSLCFVVEQFSDGVNDSPSVGAIRIYDGAYADEAAITAGKIAEVREVDAAQRFYKPSIW